MLFQWANYVRTRAHTQLGRSNAPRNAHPAARDLPGIKELRAAGLLESTPPPGDVEEDADGGIDDMFGDEPDEPAR